MRTTVNIEKCLNNKITNFFTERVTSDFVLTVSQWETCMNPFISAMSDCKLGIDNLGIHKYLQSACGITENYKTI